MNAFEEKFRQQIADLQKRVDREILDVLRARRQRRFWMVGMALLNSPIIFLDLSRNDYLALGGHALWTIGIFGGVWFFYQMNIDQARRWKRQWAEQKLISQKILDSYLLIMRAMGDDQTGQ